MASKEFKDVENVIRDYPRLPEEIRKRKAHLMYRKKETDENIGGGRTHSDVSQQEIIIVLLDQDRRLARLEEQYLVIKSEYGKLTQAKRDVIKYCYFSVNEDYTWDGIALKVGYSKKQAQNIRNDFVNVVGKRLGMLD